MNRKPTEVARPVTYKMHRSNERIVPREPPSGALHFGKSERHYAC